MSLHNTYMIVISALFAAVFAIIIHSLIRHRQACVRPAAKFTGTSGARQWLWALVPLAILAGINASLISAGGERQPKASGQQHAQR